MKTKDWSKNEELAVLAQNGDEEALDKLIRNNTGYINTRVKRFWGKTRFQDWEDLFNTGVAGFIDGVEKFDPSRGKRLLTYATPWIDKSIRESIQTETYLRIPRNGQERLGTIKRFQEEFLATHFRLPTVGEISEALGFPRDSVFELVATTKTTIHLEERQSFGDFEREGLISRKLKAKPEQPALLQTESDNRFLAMISGLSPLQQNILTLRYGFYGEPRSANQIATELGVDHKTVQAHLKRSLIHLREKYLQ